MLAPGDSTLRCVGNERIREVEPGVDTAAAGPGAPAHGPAAAHGAAVGFHGDRELFPGCLDFAVNVRDAAPPALMANALREELGRIAAYPSEDRARDVAARVGRLHGVPPEEVLLLSGGAEGFALLPALLPAAGADALACLMPSFTEPLHQAARAGIPARAVVLEPPFDLPASRAEAGLAATEALVLGNPCNPTARLYRRRDIERLVDPDRLTVVDEAFMDTAGAQGDAAEEDSLAGARLPGTVVFRSLTKTWSLAGLRVGYAIGASELLAPMAARQPHWHLGALQLRALEVAASAEGQAWLAAERARAAAETSSMRSALEAAGIAVALPPEAPFLLVTAPAGIHASSLHAALAARGVAVRRCDTFPGLGGPSTPYLRLAARPADRVERLVEAWRDAVADLRAEGDAPRDPGGTPRLGGQGRGERT